MRKPVTFEQDAELKDCALIIPCVIVSRAYAAELVPAWNRFIEEARAICAKHGESLDELARRPKDLASGIGRRRTSDKRKLRRWQAAQAKGGAR